MRVLVININFMKSNGGANHVYWVCNCILINAFNINILFINLYKEICCNVSEIQINVMQKYYLNYEITIYMKYLPSVSDYRDLNVGDVINALFSTDLSSTIAHTLLPKL